MPSNHDPNPLEALLAETPEDRFTELLAKLLRTDNLSVPFVAELCGLPRMSDKTVVRVRTQFVVPDGRADLILSSPEFVAIVEAKLGSWISGTQLQAYAKFLGEEAASSSVRRALFLLAPSANRSALLDDARVQLGKEEHIEAITWEAVAAFCRVQGEKRRGTRTGYYLEDFARLLEHRLGESPREFTADEADLLGDAVVARAMLGVLHARQLLYRKLAAKGVAISSQPSASFGFEGNTLRFANRTWWLGLWPAAWPQVGASPLVLQLTGYDVDDRVHPPSGLAPPISFSGDFGKGQVVPLRLLPNLEPEKLADHHADTVLRWMKERPESGE